MSFSLLFTLLKQNLGFCYLNMSELIFTVTVFKKKKLIDKCYFNEVNKKILI